MPTATTTKRSAMSGVVPPGRRRRNRSIHCTGATIDTTSGRLSEVPTLEQPARCEGDEGGGGEGDCEGWPGAEVPDRLGGGVGGLGELGEDTVRRHPGDPALEPAEQGCEEPRQQDEPDHD